MDEPALKQLLADVASGTVSPDEAAAVLRRLPFADLGFARVDHHRMLRVGLPEAVYGPGKSDAQVAGIVAELLSASTDPVIVTRAQPSQVKAALEAGARERVDGQVTETGPHALVTWRRGDPRPGKVMVVSAGTSDLPVAAECAGVLEALGYQPERLADCGVAGVHRLLAAAEDLAKADAVVAIAGMEGAMPSVLAGLTPAPVVAVPTSTGYGAGLEGVTALLAMLASCASGVVVMGIDNGYGAACAVARLLP